MDLDQAKNSLGAAGYTVHSIQSTRADIGHDKYTVSVTGNEFAEPKVINASFQSELERRVGEQQYDSLFGGTISPAREEAIYRVARSVGIPAPVVTIARAIGEEPFLLEEQPSGTTVKEYVMALPQDQRKEAYLDIIHKIGALFARAHSHRFEHYGDVWGSEVIDNATTNYTTRLKNILALNLAFNPHDQAFNPAELTETRKYAQDKLQSLNGMTLDDITFDGHTVIHDASAVFVLANLHRGNVHVDENREIVHAGQFNFAQAGKPASEFYNAFWQFADAAVAPTADVHKALVEGYTTNGGKIDLDNPATKAIMDLLTLNHFVRAATIYSLKQGDPIRNRWGQRFKDDILFPLMRDGTVDYDTFSTIINEKWEKA